MALKYPKFIGKNQEKMGLFRLQKQYPVGDARRYPIGLRLPIPVDVSFGSRKPVREGAMRLNSDEAIKDSSNKIKAKQLMSSVGIPVLATYQLSDYMDNGVLDIEHLDEDGGLQFPMVLKYASLSGGREMYRIDNEADFLEVLAEKVTPRVRALPANKRQAFLGKYFLEPFFASVAEYRIHASPWLFNIPMNYIFKRNVRGEDSNWRAETQEWYNNRGVMCVAKKLIRQEAYEQGRWHRSIDEDVFMKYIFEEPDHGQEFHWDELYEDAVLALRIMGLDFGCIDVLIGENGDYVFLETNSNPGISVYRDQRPALSITAQAYLQSLGRIIMEKAYEEKFYRPTVIHQNQN